MADDFFCMMTEIINLLEGERMIKLCEGKGKRVAFASVILFSIFVGVTFTVWSRRNEKPQEVWLNVFIHGSFCTVLGFLDFPKVLKDKVSGTTYRFLAKKLRDDEHFYRFQPILQRGLVKVTPTFDDILAENKRLAAYPLIKAYEIITQEVKPRSVANIFYTFGWSGLISISSRRFEAIRLYNQLSEELDRYHKMGVQPKIRIITHSHGGNLCLNLAAVHGALTSNSFDGDIKLAKDVHENESLHAIIDVLKTLVSKEEIEHLPDQKRWDYVPLNKDLFIDELIMYGTPIQQETACFACAPIFGKVFNFYSGEDIVQRADWVSSKQKLSNQRITNEYLCGAYGKKKVYQARIMVERNLVSGKYFKGCVLHKKEQLGMHEQHGSKEPNVFDQLFSGVNVFKRKTNDPTHKALWFFLCRNEAERCPTPLAYLPTMILTPLFLKAIDESDLYDCDLNIKDDGDQLFVEYTKHDNQTVYGAVMIPFGVIERIKQGTKAWSEFDVLLEKEFEAMYQHFKR